MTETTYEAMVNAYVGCAVWSSTDDDGEPLEDAYDVAPDTLEAMAKEVADFVDYVSGMDKCAADALLSSPEQAGHDFWLTRNRHGAGFWDGYWSDAVGRILTNAAHTYGSADLHVGDDGLIHQSN